MKRVFISYKSEEVKRARAIRKYLESQGISCWMAPRNIPIGSNYAREIPKAIKACGVFMLMLSEKAQKSQWISKEVSIAIGENKGILPLQLEECSLTDEYTYYLTNVQIYPLFEDEDEVMEEVAERIREILDQPEEEQKPAPVKAKSVKAQQPVNSEASEEGKPYIFISYSHRDQQKVNRIVELLETHGFRVRLDNGITVRTEWAATLAEEMKNSQCVIHFMSDNYIQSQNCRNELMYALHLGKPAVNIYLEDVSLTPGLSLQIGRKPAIHLNRLRSEDELVKELVKIPELRKCSR